MIATLPERTLPRATPRKDEMEIFGDAFGPGFRSYACRHYAHGLYPLLSLSLVNLLIGNKYPMSTEKKIIYAAITCLTVVVLYVLLDEYMGHVFSGLHP